MRWPRLVLLLVAAAVVLFGLAQLIPFRVTNHRVVREPNWDSPRTRQLAVAACFDCHSNQTRSFWYEKIAPMSWWINRHVTEGRARLNFSDWDHQSVRGATRGPRTVTRGSMPPSYYTWLGLHADARLSAADRRALADGLAATIAADPPQGPSKGD